MLAPEEIKLVHSVYNEIIREEWFPRNSENCGECAKLVLRMYQAGIDDEYRLRKRATAVARSRFSERQLAGLSLH
jgi:hypothetical protein